MIRHDVVPAETEKPEETAAPDETEAPEGQDAEAAPLDVAEQE